MTDQKQQENSELQHEQEEKTARQILQLEKQFRVHQLLVETECSTQKNFVDLLYILSRRYSELSTSRFNTERIEGALLSEYNRKLQCLRTSLKRVADSFQELQTNFATFDAMCQKIDMTAKTMFIRGNTVHKPVAFFVELLTDLYKHFQTWLLKCEYCVSQMEPENLAPLNAYRVLLKPSDEFKYHFFMGLSYCKFLTKEPLPKNV